MRHAGEHIAQGERLFLNWTAANQDPEMFSGFDPEGNAEHNPVYGIGRHVCSGRELATEQLRIFTQVLLGRTSHIGPGEQERTRSAPPAGGYVEVPITLAASSDQRPVAPVTTGATRVYRRWVRGARVTI